MHHSWPDAGWETHFGWSSPEASRHAISGVLNNSNYVPTIVDELTFSPALSAFPPGTTLSMNTGPPSFWVNTTPTGLGRVTLKRFPGSCPLALLLLVLSWPSAAAAAAAGLVHLLLLCSCCHWYRLLCKPSTPSSRCCVGQLLTLALSLVTCGANACMLQTQDAPELCGSGAAQGRARTPSEGLGPCICIVDGQTNQWLVKDC